MKQNSKQIRLGNKYRILSSSLMMAVFSLTIAIPVVNACIQAEVIEIAGNLEESPPSMQNILEEENEGKYCLSPVEGLPVSFNTLMKIFFYDYNEFEHFVADVPCPPPKA